jgi:plastocyanin
MHTLRMFVVGTAIAGAIALGAASCGGSTSSSSTSPTTGCTPSSSPATFVIMNSTVCPTTLTVSRGTQVTFSNQDVNNHEMDSDPHPEHTDCPEINQVDFIAPGQSRQTGNLNIARTCGFHDHMHPDVASMKGKIVIQ